MADMKGRLRDRARKEIRYTRGMQAMHRERFMEYIADMNRARGSGDVKRQAAIAEDLKAFVGEIWHLMEGQRSAYQRLTGTVVGASQPSAIGTDTEPPGDAEPGNLIHLFKKRPEDG